jgi:hypothetical protein
MKLDAETGARIGAAWLRAAVAPASDFGRRAEDAARPFTAGDEAAARRRCAQIVSLAGRLEPDGVAHVRAALRRAPDPAEIVSRARLGDPLSDVDFFEIGRFVDALDATARAWDAAGGAAGERPPVAEEVETLLSRGRERGAFYLADAFSDPLAAARRSYAAADADFAAQRRRLAQGVAPRLGELPENPEFILMRDVHPELPPGVRVVRETPAYRLVALELDAAGLASAARREAALAAVGREEDLVRLGLAVGIARCGEALLIAARALGELDRTLARVTFTQRWGGCIPEFAASHVAFVDASHVPLRAALEAEWLPYTPISLDLSGAAVLTGPNMGGKSAALATCGFLAACVAIGVPPPARSAVLPLFAGVAWIGGEPAVDRERLLSAFGGEVVRARDALAQASAPALFLVDEFARTTGPREGRALLVALVEALARRGGTFALVATHFDGVARTAGVPHFTIAGLGPRSLDAHAARDIHAALDAVAQAMDYRIIAVDGDAHSHSDALALAGLLGLDSTIVDRAAELYARPATGPIRAGTE